MFTARDMEVVLYVGVSFLALAILVRMLVRRRNEVLRQLSQQAEQEHQRQELARKLAAHKAALEVKRERRQAA